MNTATHNPMRGIPFSQLAQCLAAARGDLVAAVALAQGKGLKKIALAIKEIMTGISTEDGAPLLPEIGFDFSELLRPQTIIGRITGMRRVPVNVKMLSQSAGTTANWRGEGQPKPVTMAGFTVDTLPPATVASIAVITEELAKSSAPSAVSVISRDMVRAGAQAMDAAFIDPANAGIPDVMPASVTYGAPSFVSSGATIDNLRNDISLCVNSILESGSTLEFVVVIMHPRTAQALATWGNDAPAFPGISIKGGFLFGMPVITSGNVPISAASGSPSSITLLDASQIALADDGESELSVTTQATVQMETAPETGSTAQVSLWQNNLVGLRVERTVNWRRRHPNVVASLTGVTY